MSAAAAIVGAPGPNAALADARVLFSAMDLAPSERLLIERSYQESSPGLRRCAWLLCSQPGLLKDALLAPMTRWGASSSYEPLREYERALRLSYWIRLDSMPGAPILPTRKGQKPRLPWRWRWAFAGLMLAGSPLSFFAAIPMAQWLGHMAGSAWVLLGASAVLPPIMGEIERRVLFFHWPRLNPARAIIARWMGPQAKESEMCALRARDCFELHAGGDDAVAPPTMGPVGFQASPRLKAGETEDDPRIGWLVELAALCEAMIRHGRDPGVDAALVVLADNDRSALMDVLGVDEGSLREARRRPRSI